MASMKLLIRAAMVFFATLLVAALVTLGAPFIAELVSRSETSAAPVSSAQVLASFPFLSHQGRLRGGQAI
jgi:hypothetical protein